MSATGRRGAPKMLEFGVADGNTLQKVDDSAIPLSAWLGPVGMPGVTAWVGTGERGLYRADDHGAKPAAGGADNAASIAAFVFLCVPTPQGDDVVDIVREIKGCPRPPYTILVSNWSLMTEERYRQVD